MPRGETNRIVPKMFIIQFRDATVTGIQFRDATVTGKDVRWENPLVTNTRFELFKCMETTI